MSWREAFLDAARRRGLSEQTIKGYAFHLHQIVDQHHLNLEECSREELFSFLDECQRKHSLAYYGLHVTLIKMILNFIGRDKLADKIERPQKPDPAASIQVLPKEDIQRLIREAPNLQDRLLIELLDEVGARRGELAGLRIRDIQFDEYGAIIHLSGKSGVRRRRVYGCVPDLREHINNHPQRSNPDAALFLTSTGKPFDVHAIYRRIKTLGERILKRKIHPHQFRHTRATEDSRYFTDREMMKLYGWKGPQMVGVYSHLSMRDVEDKDLVLHGLKRKEEILRPISQIIKCVCGQENAPIAIYCVKCGEILPNQQLSGLDRILAEPEFIKRLINSESFKDALRKALGEQPINR